MSPKQLFCWLVEFSNTVSVYCHAFTHDYHTCPADNYSSVGHFSFTNWTSIDWQSPIRWSHTEVSYRLITSSAWRLTSNNYFIDNVTLNIHQNNIQEFFFVFFLYFRIIYKWKLIKFRWFSVRLIFQCQVFNRTKEVGNVCRNRKKRRKKTQTWCRPCPT